MPAKSFDFNVKGRLATDDDRLILRILNEKYGSAGSLRQLSQDDARKAQLRAAIHAGAERMTRFYEHVQAARVQAGFIVTREWLDTNMTPARGYTRPQLQQLGVEWPPKSGWRVGVIGMLITAEQKQAFEKGRVDKRTRRRKAKAQKKKELQ